MSGEGWEPEPSYSTAVHEAMREAGGVSHRVYCLRHGGEVGVIRYSSNGPLFSAEVPLEAGAGLADHLAELRRETGERPPPPVYMVRVLIDRLAEAEDPPMAWCEPGRHRISLETVDFGPHSVRVRVKPV